MAATKHKNYLYYITCDRPKKNIDNWLISLGYTELGQSKQVCPDLVIIDFHRKLYIYFDIKNCTIQNVEKYFSFDDQFLVFFGHLSASDRLKFISFYTNKQIISLIRVINDIKSTPAQKAEAQLLHNEIIKGNFSQEELFNLDNIATVISNENNIEVIDPTIIT